LKILDVLIGQILREPVPDTLGFEFPPQNNDETTYLTLEYIGRHTYRLYGDEPGAVAYYADDFFDLVERSRRSMPSCVTSTASTK
jgi:hypothetical protein